MFPAKKRFYAGLTGDGDTIRGTPGNASFYSATEGFDPIETTFLNTLYNERDRTSSYPIFPAFLEPAHCALCHYTIIR